MEHHTISKLKPNIFRGVAGGVFKDLLRLNLSTFVDEPTARKLAIQLRKDSFHFHLDGSITIGLAYDLQDLLRQKHYLDFTDTSWVAHYDKPKITTT